MENDLIKQSNPVIHCRLNSEITMCILKSSSVKSVSQLVLTIDYHI